MPTTETSVQKLHREIARLRNRLEELELLQERTAQAEQALRESEERYRLAAENATDVIWVMDMGMQYTYVSPSVHRLRGYTVEEALAQSVEEQLTPASYETVQHVLATELERANPDPSKTLMMEVEVYRKDGTTFWTEAHMTFVRDDAGNPIKILGVSRDISKRKEAEQELKKWARIFDNATWGIAVSTPDGKHIDFANRAYARMHGYSVDEIQGMPIENFYAPNTLEDRKRFRHAITEKGYHAFETQHVRKNGDVFPVRIEAHAVKNGRGETLYGTAHVQDITEEKRAERAVQVASRMEATATLAGGIAHDFNNLMVGVLGNASLAKLRLSDGQDCARILTEIENAAEQAADLAQQILAFARGGKYQSVPLNVNEKLVEVLNLQNHMMPSRITVHRNLADNLSNIEADPAQLGQLVVNLCLNAVEAIEAHGLIDVKTKNVDLDGESSSRHGLKPGPYVELTVRDTGQGMDQETLTHMYEPYFTTKGRGRGLGLAAAYGIVKNHYGAILADSRPGEGTTFRVYLPATSASAPARKVAVDSPGTGTETILVVDDEEMVLSVTRQLLERFGYNVLCAENGKDAVELAEKYEGPIDAAILDMGMPVMTGAEAFPHLQRMRPSMKVIVCSGYELDEASQALLDGGASAFLLKPFRPSTLFNEIRNALAE